MSLHIVAALLSVVAIALLAIVGRLGQGSWYAPGPMTASVWFVAAALPMVIAPHYHVVESAHLLVLVLVALTVAGSTLGIGLARGQTSRQLTASGLQQRITTWYLVLLGCAVALPIFGWSIAARSLDPVTLLELPRVITSARYLEDFTFGRAFSLMASGLYASAALGGMLFAFRSSSGGRRSVTFAWIIPAVATALLSTGRAVLLFTVVLWLAGAVAGVRLLGGSSLWPVGRTIGFTIGLVIVLFVAFASIGLLRRHEASTAGLSTSFLNTRRYFAGHLVGLGMWLSHRPVRTPQLGKQTLAGLADVVGLDARQVGLYAELVEAAPGEVTNIFTAIRPLVEDFTLPGVLLITFVWSTISGFSWQAAAGGSRVAAAFLILHSCFVLASPIASFFAYNSLLLALVISGAALCLPLNADRLRWIVGGTALS